MRYAVILCDIGGVAVRFDSDRVILQMSQLLGRTVEEVQRVIYHPELFRPFETGRMTPQAYYEGLKQRLALSWTYDQFVRAWTDIFTVDEDVLSLLGRLREHHKILALSNTNRLHVEYLKRTFPSLAVFDEWVVSCEVGACKPDPAIYRAALERAGARTREAFYIDDRPELVAAGQSLGLAAIRFESLQQLEHDLRQLGFNM